MRYDSHGFSQYDREEIIELIKKWCREHGKIKIRDLRHKNNMPSVTQVISIFGSFKNCLLESGVGIDKNVESMFNRKSLSDEELLNKFKSFVDKHLQTHITLPTFKDIDNDKSFSNKNVFIERFKTIDDLYLKIGYDKNEFNKLAIENDMIDKYIKACEKYKHVLNSREINYIFLNNKDELYSMSAYINHFGSLHNLQEKCNMIKTRPGKDISNEEAIDLLKKLGELLGRKPIGRDLKFYDFMPSENLYVRRFGSFSKSLEIAGYDKKRNLITKHGIKCNSTYELKLAQVMESYEINFINEVYYKDVIPDFKRKYKFDFVISMNNEKYYVELFGIEGNEFYEKRKKEKIQICKDNNLKLLQIYQYDIYSRTNEEILNMLIKKISEVDNVKRGDTNG